MFGGYFNIRGRLLWEFKSFLCHRMEMMFVYKITLYVWLGFEIKLTLLWENTAKIGNLVDIFYSDRTALSILRFMKYQGRRRYLVFQWREGPPRVLMTAASRRRNRHERVPVQIRYSNINPWTSSYHIPCNADMQRAVLGTQEQQPAHTRWYLASMNFPDISS